MGLTASRRITQWGDDHQLHLRREDIPNNKWLLGNDILYRNYLAIAQVENFCKAANARLFIISLLDRDIHYEQVHTINHYIHNTLPRKIDVGSDKMHPGPVHHAHLADLIFKEISK